MHPQNTESRVAESVGSEAMLPWVGLIPTRFLTSCEIMGKLLCDPRRIGKTTMRLGFLFYKVV